jgi:hypothetical protein
MKALFLAFVFTILIVSSVNAQSTLALQEKCVEGAKKLVLETGGCGTTSEKGFLLSCQYRCHYNKKLDRCFIRWDLHTFWDKKYADLVGRNYTIRIEFGDVFERRLIGQYDKSIVFGECKVGDKKCNSLEEFEALIKPYMEE